MLCRAAIGQAASHTKLDLLLGTPTAAEALSRVLTVIDVNPDALPAAVDLFPGRPDQILGCSATARGRVRRRPGRMRPAAGNAR